MQSQHQSIKWPKILSGPNMAAEMWDDDRVRLPDAPYRAKVKIHGTNCAVQIHPDGSVVAPSRNRIIVPGDDNHGFAGWVAEHEAAFRALAGPVEIVVFGELFGAGILRGTAANSLGSRYWGVFAILVGATLFDDPDYIDERMDAYAGMLDGAILPFTIPWFSWVVRPFVSTTGDLAPDVQAAADEVGALDPVVRDVAGVAGPGEGLVYYPVGDVGRPFKVKASTFTGREDRPKRTSKKVVDMKARAAHQEIAEQLATPARIAQGFDEIGGRGMGRSAIGPLLSWLAADITAECAVGLEQHGITYRQIGTPVAAIVRAWIDDEIGGVA